MEKRLSFGQVKTINIQVSGIIFIKSLKKNANAPENCKTLDLIKPDTEKSYINSGPRKSFEIKYINKEENYENSNPHQNFEMKSKISVPHQSFEKKN